MYTLDVMLQNNILRNKIEEAFNLVIDKTSTVCKNLQKLLFGLINAGNMYRLQYQALKCFKPSVKLKISVKVFLIMAHHACIAE